jgi:molecular chaperone GrpE
MSDEKNEKEALEVFGIGDEITDFSAKPGSASELDEQRKQNLYLRADFENFKRQAIKERSELLKYGSEPLIREFLNIYDNLERAAATEVTPETLAVYKSGVEMIVGLFKKTLDRFGVEEIDSLHQTFDPNLHEALSSEENPDLPSGVVSRVFKKGFRLNGKVVRPAQVVVNTAASEKSEIKD